MSQHKYHSYQYQNLLHPEQDQQQNQREYRKKKKVNAERHRRLAITERLNHLRQIFNLNQDITRIQLLRYMADVFIDLTSGGKERERNFAHCNQFESEICIIPQENENMKSVESKKSNKACIEQYRRFLERKELDRIQSILGFEKISDVQLLDKLIEFVKSKENLIILATSKQPITNQSVRQSNRTGLRLLNENFSHTKTTEKLVEKNQLVKTTCQPKQFNHLTHSGNINTHYWRPWEDLG